MRPAALALLQLAGCNGFYGLGDVTQTPADAVYYDAPDAAPPECPADGVAPAFPFLITQTATGDCTYFAPADTGMAMARCSAPNMPSIIAYGDVRFELPQVAVAVSSPVAPRLAADGRFAVVNVPGTVNGTFVTVTIAPDGSGAWLATGSLGTPQAMSLFVSTPSRDHHVVEVDDSTGPFVVTEVSDASGAWAPTGASYPLSDLGVSSLIGGPSLTPDGLHLVMQGRSVGDTSIQIFVAARTSAANKFGVASVIDVPAQSVVTPYMTNNCGRLYFAALHATLYVGR